MVDRMRLGRLGPAILAGMTVVAVPTTQGEEAGYCFHDLGTFGGATSHAYGINDADPPQVVGDADLASGRHRGFVYSDWESGLGLSEALHAIPDVLPSCLITEHCNTSGRAINDAGDVVGIGTTPSVHHGLEYPPLKDLGTLDVRPNAESYAIAVNDSGLCVGLADAKTSSGFRRHACVWDDGRLVDLDAGADVISQAGDVNDRRRIVGRRDGVAYSWSDATGSWVGETIDAARPSAAFGINETDEIVGMQRWQATSWRLDADGDWIGSHLEWGGPRSIAYGVDDTGRIVGKAWHEREPAAYLWTPTPPLAAESVHGRWSALDLNTLSAVPEGWHLASALEINANGWILAEGFVDGDGDGARGPEEPERAVVLQPVDDVATCFTAEARRAPGSVPESRAEVELPTAAAPTLEPQRASVAGGLLWDNGSLMSGIGCGDAPASPIERPSTFWGHDTALGVYHQADDFTVPVGDTWQLTSTTWRLYQTGATLDDTVQQVYVRLYDAPPTDGLEPFAGDLTTDRRLSAAFSGVYRDDGDGSCARPIQDVSVDLSWLPELGEGTYWLEIATVGTEGLSGPWATHKTPRAEGDNSRTLDVASGVWSDNLDDQTGGAWDYPFQLFGSGGSAVLAVDTNCPTGGAIDFRWGGATPEGEVMIAFATELGEFSVPAGPCAGTAIALAPVDMRVVVSEVSDSLGAGYLKLDTPSLACRGHFQLVDLTTCAVSSTVAGD